MNEKRDVLRYLVLGVILAGLIGILFVLRGGSPTGYVVYTDIEQAEFDNGTYVNTGYIGGAVVLVGSNLTGSYISQVFDVGYEASWNNISWVGEIKEVSNSYLTSAMHLDINQTEIFVKDETYYLADMKDSSKNFYLNFSEDLINGTILKIYAKKDKGVTIGIYAQSDINGNNALGVFSVDSVSGAWYNVTLDISTPTNVIWIGEGVGSGIAPKEEFDYIYAEIPGTILDVQIRSCDDVDCSGESFTDLLGNSPQDLPVSDNRYFQYKFDFLSPAVGYTSSLQSVEVDYTVLNSPPSINVVLPQEGASYGSNESIALDFSASDADSNIDGCWYNIDNGVNVSIASCANTTFDVAGDGSYVLNIFVNDSFGLEARDGASFSVQLGAPSIVLDYPMGIYLNSGNNIEFNYTPTDIDLDSCWLLGDFTGIYSINQTDNSPTNAVGNTFNLNLDDGEYLWNIGCNDSIGNSAINGNKTFYVDGVDPVVSISEPAGAKTSRTGIAISFSASDEYALNCSYNLTTSVGTPIVSEVAIANCLDTTLDVSSDGDYIIYLRVEDLAGNSETVNSSFSVDTSSVTPPGDPGGGGGGGGGGGSALPKNQTGKLELSEIGDIIAYQGDKKPVSLGVENTGRVFLNNCRLKVSGDLSSWIYSTQIEGIAPGENIDFIFDINIPEGIDGGDYLGELEISCDEGISSQEINVGIPEGLKIIKISSIVNEEDGLNINYNFDNSNIIGEEVSVEIWMEDETGSEINRIYDDFSINKDGLIERSVIMELPEDLTGIYYIYFALTSDLDDFVRQSIVLGETLTTGRVILGNTRNDIISYVAFVIIIFAGLVFTIVRHKKHVVKSEKKKGKKKNKWLLRKRKA